MASENLQNYQSSSVFIEKKKAECDVLGNITGAVCQSKEMHKVMGSFHWKFLSKNTILRHVTGGDLNLHNLIKNGNCLKELEPRENTAKRKQQYPYQEFDAPWTPGD